MLIAHVGQPVEPHDLWAAWNLDPLVLGGLLMVALVYGRGRRIGDGRTVADRRRDGAFLAAVIVLGIALVSPLDAAAASLASAHMVQHVLLILVAAPLLVASRLGPVFYRAGPRALTQATRHWRHRLRRPIVRLVENAVLVTLTHVGVVWVWHAAGPYEAAIANAPVHALEHLGFLVTAFLFWRMIWRRRAVNEGGVVVVSMFVMSLQGVLLAALLTFANSPWYSTYVDRAPAFGLTPLGDQQLAGLIMWVPSGLVYVGFALGSLVRWLGSVDGAPNEAPSTRVG